MRQYELTYLVSDKVPEADLQKVTGTVAGYIAHDGGKLLKEEIWKRKKLAYPINKQDFATYVSINFELPAPKVNAFDRHIRLTREIIRHLLIVKDLGSEKLTLTQDEIVATEDIEAVVGGEKAFEAVEGETEESRDLQAIREKEDEKEEQVEEVKETEEPKEETPEVKEEITEEQETEKTEKVAEPEEKKETKKPRAKKAEKGENEADRLAKLDEELDNILKDEL